MARLDISGQRVALWLVLSVVIGGLAGLVAAALNIEMSAPVLLVLGALVGVMSAVVLRPKKN